MGCFEYENVDGAAANALPGHVPEEVKAERYDRLMQHQQAISTELLRARVGKNIEVMLGTGRALLLGCARDRRECLSPTNLTLKPGDRLMVTVEDSNEYDLWASPFGLENGAI